MPLSRNPYFLPVVIVLAGVLLGVAIYVVRTAANPLGLPHPDTASIRPVDDQDHFLGNPAAPVTVVEYSDIDCSYCKQFDEAMEQVMADHAAAGNVAWVFRHFPVIETHPDAATHAAAAECVASVGGNKAFWAFVRAVRQAAPNDEEFDPKGYPSIVESLGFSADTFETCLTDGSTQKRVEDDYDNALSIGAYGAPYTVILIKGADPLTISGAIPYQALTKVIDLALSKAK